MPTFQICCLILIGLLARDCHCILPLPQPVPIPVPSRRELLLIQDDFGGRTTGGLRLLPFPILLPIVAMMAMTKMESIMMMTTTLPPTTTVPTTTVATTTPTPIFQSGALVCENGVLILDCPAPSRIVVSSAIYGRTEPATVCPLTPSATTNTNCQSAASNAIVQALCNGQQRCTITVNNANLGPDPCPGTFKYLNVRYRCI